MGPSIKFRAPPRIVLKISSKSQENCRVQFFSFTKNEKSPRELKNSNRINSGVIQHYHQGAYGSGEGARGARVVSHTWICEVFLNEKRAFGAVPEKATLVEFQEGDWLDDSCFFLYPDCFTPSPWTPW